MKDSWQLTKWNTLVWQKDDFQFESCLGPFYVDFTNPLSRFQQEEATKCLGVVFFLLSGFPGDVLWSQNYGSPVVGVYLYAGDSLRHAPHLSIAMETLRFLTFSSAKEQAEAHSTLKWSYQFVKEQAAAQTQLV